MSTLSITTLEDRASLASTPVLNAINGSAKAWVNFDGTGTVAIRASYNVSSITDNGAGLYTVNFTNALPDANYSVSCTSSWDSTVPNAPGTAGLSTSGTYSTSAIRISTGQGTGTLFDSPLIMVQIFR